MFRKVFLVSSLALGLSVNIANAKVITVDVKGLVCEFCASTIEKAFKKMDEIGSVKVDLETKVVTIDTKDGKDITDEKIKSTILNNGYNVEKINR